MQGKSNFQFCHYTKWSTATIVLETKEEGEEDRKERGNLLVSHQVSTVLPLSLPNTPVEKKQNKNKTKGR